MVRKHVKKYYTVRLLKDILHLRLKNLTVLLMQRFNTKTYLAGCGCFQLLTEKYCKVDMIILNIFQAWMICDDPSCGQLTRDVPSVPQRGAPLCVCKRGHLYPEVKKL